MRRPLLHVVGLGPGSADLVTAGTAELVARFPTHARYLRTERHPAAVDGDSRQLAAIRRVRAVAAEREEVVQLAAR